MPSSTKMPVPLSNRKEYLAKKVQGICVAKGCIALAAETSVWCAQHYQLVSAAKQATYATPAYCRSHRKYQRERREERAAKGLCARCNRPAVTSLCRVHQLEAAERARKNDKRPRKGQITTCSYCRKPGHRVSTCPERYNKSI